MTKHIDYQKELNPAQFKAATTLEGPVLVIAGAGSGKTRTIVYRLAKLLESGVPSSQILLLTFTRKAAHEMLERVKRLLETSNEDYIDSSAIQGGTFHAYAYSILRIFPPIGYPKNIIVMDQSDILSAIQHCKEENKIGKGDRSFPKNQTIYSLFSKSINKEIPLEEAIRKDAYHLLSYADDIATIMNTYITFKQEKGLMDYDDLLFCFENTLKTNSDALNYCRQRHKYIMVDEYQDTNPVQARIAALLAGFNENAEAGTTNNIMVVGDDAQSIYAFRGADVRNILYFSEFFTGTTHIQLEENYRSTQPILDLTNAILANATEGFNKHLFTNNKGGNKPTIIKPLSDRTQANIVASRIIELLRVYQPEEIAVLFRSGFHSYALEVQLNKIGIKFRKYGGIRYTEAAHIKDVVSFLRLILNPLDFTAFLRMASLTKGIGPKTCLKFYQLLTTGKRDELIKATQKYPEFSADLELIDMYRTNPISPERTLFKVIENYTPRLKTLYPDDYPRREQGLEQLLQIASSYDDLDLFIADLALEDAFNEEEERSSITLSTIHSAKGLEWSAVLILDLVEERFPSKHSLVRPEDFEEERRLMYVACTRAKECLELFVPGSLYDRGTGGSIPAIPSPFIRELPNNLYDEYHESYTGALVFKQKIQLDAIKKEPSNIAQKSSSSSFGNLSNNIDNPNKFSQDSSALGNDPNKCGFCYHKIFGRGKVVQHLPPDKVKVNFPGIGLKVLMSAYVVFENKNE